MMSGRGLGHTGGTLDKLESIPGFRTRLSLAETSAQIEQIGCALIGQSEEIAPADRRLYALRDATATVESIPLIAASIMSKKLAEGLTGLVLDIKRGSGAFMPQVERGLELAQTMVALGAQHGLPVVALLTAMDRPLGRACGNALELEEAINALHGEGPPDLMRVTYALGAEMLVLGGLATNRDAARRAMEVADLLRTRGGEVPRGHRGAGRRPGRRRRSVAPAPGGLLRAVLRSERGFRGVDRPAPDRLRGDRAGRWPVPAGRADRPQRGLRDRGAAG